MALTDVSFVPLPATLQLAVGKTSLPDRCLLLRFQNECVFSCMREHVSERCAWSRYLFVRVGQAGRALGLTWFETTVEDIGAETGKQHYLTIKKRQQRALWLLLNRAAVREDETQTRPGHPHTSHRTSVGVPAAHLSPRRALPHGSRQTRASSEAAAVAMWADDEGVLSNSGTRTHTHVIPRSLRVFKWTTVELLPCRNTKRRPEMV